MLHVSKSPFKMKYFGHDSKGISFPRSDYISYFILHVSCIFLPFLPYSPFMFIQFGQSTRVSCVLRLWILYMFVGVQIACFKSNSITPAPFGKKIKSFSILSNAVETRGRVKNSRCSYFALEKNVSLNVKKSRGLKTCSAMVIHFEQQ